MYSVIVTPIEALGSFYYYVGLTTYAPFDNKCLPSFWVTFKSSKRLGEKRVLFLNSPQNSSIFLALWLLISILSYLKLKISCLKQEMGFTWYLYCLISHLNGTKWQLSELRPFDGNQRMQKWPKMINLFTNVSFGCNPTEAFKSHLETWEVSIIKWSICGEPNISIKPHQGYNRGHNYVLHYIVHLSPPCKSLLLFEFSC